MCKVLASLGIVSLRHTSLATHGVKPLLSGRSRAKNQLHLIKAVPFIHWVLFKTSFLDCCFIIQLSHLITVSFTVSYLVIVSLYTLILAELELESSDCSFLLFILPQHVLQHLCPLLIEGASLVLYFAQKASKDIVIVP